MASSGHERALSPPSTRSPAPWYLYPQLTHATRPLVPVSATNACHLSALHRPSLLGSAVGCKRPFRAAHIVPVIVHLIRRRQAYEDVEDCAAVDGATTALALFRADMYMYA